MDKDTSWRVIDQQRVALADLLDTLTPEQWSTPSLCEGWTVRDVAAHLSMAATARAELALRAVLKRYALDAYSYQFLAFGKDPAAAPGPSPQPSSSPRHSFSAPAA